MYQRSGWDTSGTRWFVNFIPVLVSCCCCWSPAAVMLVSSLCGWSHWTFLSYYTLPEVWLTKLESLFAALPRQMSRHSLPDYASYSYSASFHPFTHRPRKSLRNLGCVAALLWVVVLYLKNLQTDSQSSSSKFERLVVVVVPLPIARHARVRVE